MFIIIPHDTYTRINCPQKKPKQVLIGVWAAPRTPAYAIHVPLTPDFKFTTMEYRAKIDKVPQWLTLFLE